MNLIAAEVHDGVALLTGDDGRQISVYIDDNLRAHSGRECSILVGDHYVTYLMPLGSDGVLNIPLNMRVGHTDGS